VLVAGLAACAEELLGMFRKLCRSDSVSEYQGANSSTDEDSEYICDVYRKLLHTDRAILHKGEKRRVSEKYSNCHRKQDRLWHPEARRIPKRALENRENQRSD